MTNKHEATARELYKWSVEEMGFPAQSDGERKFMKLCRGSDENLQVWKHVMATVKSPRSVEKIKQNVKFQQLKRSSNNEHESESEKVIKQIMQMTEHNERLHTQINAKKKELAKNEKLVRRQQLEVENKQRKFALIKTYLAKAMDHRTDTTRIKEKFQQMSENVTKKLSDKNAPAGSSQCMKEVEVALNDLEEFWNKMLNGHYGQNRDALSRDKAVVWQKVAALYQKYSANALKEAIISQCGARGQSLKNRADAVDIEKDTGKLGFDFKHGCVEDVSSQPSALKTLQQINEENQENLWNLFVTTERHKNKSHGLQIRIKENLEQAHCFLDTLFSHDPVSLQVAKKLLAVELNIISSRSAHRTLTETRSQLQETVRHAAREQQLLNENYVKIQDFTHVAKQKQNVIQVLVKQNTNSTSVVEEQRQEIENGALKRLNVFKDNPDSSVLSIRGHVLQDVKSAMRLSLPYALLTSLNNTSKMAVLDLSIYRMEADETNASGRQLNLIKETLGLSMFSNTDDVLKKVFENQLELDELLEQMSHQPNNTETNEQHLADLMYKVKALTLDRGCIRDDLKKRQKEANLGLTQCLQVKDALQEWWEQPAQHLVPWLKVDGLTFQDWRDRWTLGTTRLRQLRLSSMS